MNVLIVDDNSDNLYMLHTLLNGNGYDVLTANDGIQALQVLRSEGVGLVISDILMPKMDGFQLCREVRADDRLRQTPFVFYTATYTSEEDERFALDLGADRFILKPSEPEAFLAIIADVLVTAKKGLIEPSVPRIDHEEYFSGYALRLKDKLEDKVAQVRESESRYRNLFHSLRDVVIISDLQGCILDVNQPALRTTFGYEVEELRGNHCQILYPDGAAARVSDVPAYAGSLIETDFRRKDGTLFHGELSAMKLIGDNGLHVGNIDVIRDVSTQKMLEAQLQQARKMEAVGRLAGGVAHDFNNKLTVIIGYVDLLKHFKPSWEDVEAKLDLIAHAALQSRDITRQLLAFSRKDVISPRIVNLNELIDSACKNLGRLIGEDIQLKFDLSSGLWPVRLDPTQVDQIVMNLAINARDAMPAGGSLRFTTSNVQVGEECCREHSDTTPGDYVRLTIRDTGYGMDEETLSHIFEPFFTTKEVGRGTGLGLATIYGIVIQNGGFIGVSSKPGCGTSFVIHFPRWVQVAQPADAISVPLVTGSASGVILLVEDDEAVREVTIGLLQLLGYTVIAKATPDEAVSFCSAGHADIDLILADVVMPGMNGKEMIRRIDTVRPGIPVLYMSGYSSHMATLQEVLEDGVNFIRKPFDLNTLHAKLVSILHPKKKG